jgi:hypothetical protein
MKRRSTVACGCLTLLPLVACRAAPAPRAGEPPPNAALRTFTPDPTLSRAFGGVRVLSVSLSRRDTLLLLSLPCPEPSRSGGPAAASVVIGRDSSTAELAVGPDAHVTGMGYAVTNVRHADLRAERATAGAYRVTGIEHDATGACTPRGTVVVTVDSVVFPSARLTLRRPVTLAVTLPAP